MTRAGAFPGLDTTGRITGTVIAAVVIEAAMVWRFGWRPALAPYSFLAAIGAVVSATDFAARRIPNPIVLPPFPITAVLLAIACAPSGPWWPLARAGIGAAVLGGFYLALGLVFAAGVGFGDVKWAAVLGAYLGWLRSSIATGTLIAFLGAAVALAATRLARQRRATLPMAPFMTLGAVVAVLATR